MIQKVFWFFLLIGLSSPAMGKIYSYQDLENRDLDQMNKVITKKLGEADKALQDRSKDEDEATQDAVEILRDTLKFALSRPDPDFMSEKIVPRIRTRLRNLSAYDDSLAIITMQAINNLKKGQSKPKHGATALYILQNVLSELKPRLTDSVDAQDIYNKIYKAKIEVPRGVIKHIRKNARYKRTDSPSKIAKKVLKQKSLLTDD